MTKESDSKTRNKRMKIQMRFWSQVGSAEHINIPKLEDAVRKEFCTASDRIVRAQVKLMQTEGRVRVQDKVKVWINQPEDA
jgi:hypothetical protein